MQRHIFTRLFVVLEQKTKGARMKKEIYISVKDLVAECIRKAWIIIISMIVFAVLLTGYKYKKDLSVVPATVKEEVKNTGDALADLNEADYNKVMSYVQLAKNVSGQEAYISNALLMKIDPYRANIANLQYYVSVTDENKKNDTIVAYLGYIGNGGLAEDMYEIDDSVSIEDIKSVIICDATGPSTTGVMLENYSNVININVYGESDEQCKTFAELIKTCLGNYNAKLNGLTENSVTIIDESYGVQASTNLITYQNDRINALATWNTRLLEESKELDPKHLELAEQVIALNNETSEDITDGQTDTADVAEETVKPVKVSISKKYAVIGALVGIILAMFGIIIVYIIDGRLKTAKELQMMYGIRTFGSIASHKLNIFETLANKICYRTNKNNVDETGDYCASQITTLCKNLDSKNLVFIGEDKTLEALDKLQILEKLNIAGINAEYVGDVLSDAAAVRALNKDKKVVLVEIARKSYYTNIEQRINEIQNQGVEILGYITIK